MTECIILWTFVLLLAIIAEALTSQMISIWFAAGAFGALLAAVFEVPFYAQMIIFFIVSGIALAVFWILKNKFRSVSPPEKTNYDRIIGEEAIVIQKIDNMLGTGQINIHGQIWTARSEENNLIDTGFQVEILRIEGVKAIVRPIA